MLKITPEAIEQFRGVLSQENNEGAHIRIFVNGMGWSGPSLALALDESVEETQDLQEEIDGISIVYEKKIAPFVNDSIIDYHTGPQTGFSIRRGCSDSGCSSCRSE